MTFWFFCIFPGIITTDHALHASGLQNTTVITIFALVNTVLKSMESKFALEHRAEALKEGLLEMKVMESGKRHASYIVLHFGPKQN